MMNDKIRMLLVEDEQTLADIIADTLGEKEFDVTVAYNGAYSAVPVRCIQDAE